MSASLFRSKQFKSKKNLKTLTISGPLSLSAAAAMAAEQNVSPKQPPTVASSKRKGKYPVIVLVAKYKFEAENPEELSIDVRDYLKLLEREGNGWLKVQMLEKNDKVGIVPASFVGIAVNDIVNPISIEWLNEYKLDNDYDSSLEEVESRSLVDLKDQTTIANEDPFPVSACVAKVYLDSTNKYWYRTRMTMSTNEDIYVGKCYQQFYKLHTALVLKYPEETLPKLPLPVRSSSVLGNKRYSTLKYDRKFLKDLNALSEGLNSYFNNLLLIRSIQTSSEVYSFIFDSPYVKLSHKESNIKEDDNMMAEVVHKLAPKSIDINELLSSTGSFSATEPLPPLKTSLLTSPRKHSSIIDPNMKCSAYIQQKEKKIVNSTSNNTLVSYSSLIDGYDDSEEEKSSGKEDSYAESEESKNDSIDTKATSFEDEFEEAKDFKAHPYEEFKPSKPIADIKSNSISNFSYHRTPRDSSKFGHSYSNSGSDLDSLFSHKGSSPTTPILATSGFLPDAEVGGSPATPSTPIIEEQETSSMPLTSSYLWKEARKARGRSDTSLKYASGQFNVTQYMDSIEAPGSSTLGQFPSKRKDSATVPLCNANDYIKIKIYLNNREDDIVALKIKRNNLISILYLKKLLSFKIYKDYNLINHYKLQANESSIDELDDTQLLQYIKSFSKVSLRLVRLRS